MTSNDAVIAQRKAKIIEDIEAALNSIPGLIAESMPEEYREQIRAAANRELSKMAKKLRNRIGADEIESIVAAKKLTDASVSGTRFP